MHWRTVLDKRWISSVVWEYVGLIMTDDEVADGIK